jgi:hypothetical protein
VRACSVSSSSSAMLRISASVAESANSDSAPAISARAAR